MHKKPHINRLPKPDVGASSMSAAELSNHMPLDDAALVPLRSGLKGRYGCCPVDAILNNPHAVRTQPWQLRPEGQGAEQLSAGMTT